MAYPSYRKGQHQQRGAVAVFAAVALVAMVIAALLAVEIGRLYSTHRDLHKLTSLAALDAARVVGGCDREDAIGADDVNADVVTSLASHGMGASAVAQYSTAVALGTQTSSDGLRILDAGAAADEADAVAVTLTRAFPTPLLPLLPATQARTMSATAYARQGVVGQIKIGTSLLSLDAADSALLNGLLSALLGSSVSLSVADFQGLANARVSLAELVEAAPAVATPGDLLELNLTLPGALQLVADALDASGDAGAGAAADRLDTLAALADPDRNAVRLGELLVVEAGVETLAAKLPLNALDLLTGLAQLAAQGYQLDLPLAGLVSIPGIADVSAALRVGQAPQIALGRPGYKADGTPRTVARSAQLAIVADIALLDVSGLLGLPGNPALNLDLLVEVGQGQAVLRQVRCARSGGLAYHEATADVQTAVARIALGKYDNPAAANPNIVAPDPLVALPGVLRIGFAQPVIAGVGSQAEAIANPPFQGPFPPKVAFDTADHQRHVGDDAGAVLGGVGSGLVGGASSSLSCTASGLVGVALCPVINLVLPNVGSVSTLLAPALTLLDSVLADLLRLSGASLGAADVSLESLKVEQPYVFRVE